MHTLLAIVEVPEADRVQCQAAGCGHGVFRRIHVVQHDARLLVLGGDCYSKLYGGGPERAQVALWGAGCRRLTPQEREMLVSNTAALIRRLKEEALQLEAQRQQAEREKLAQEQRRLAEQQARLNEPWPRAASGRRQDLDQYRAQMALRAAKDAVVRQPAFGAYPLQEVAAAMATAKAACVDRGLKLDSAGSADEIRLAALALLQGKR